MNNNFDKFYYENDKFLNASQCKDDVKYRCKGFFSDDTLNYQLMKQTLQLKNTKNDAMKSKARELFRNVFRMPHKTDNLVIETDALLNIVKNFGDRILAHGVEESKGGMTNLLMMAMINKVHSPAQHFAPMVQAGSSVSSLGHGPYYLIYSMPSHINQTNPNNPNFTDIAKVLVPFNENKIMLTDKLKDMLQLELISPEAIEDFINKIMTYDELNTHLELYEATSSARPPEVSQNVSCLTMFSSSKKRGHRELPSKIEAENDFSRETKCKAASTQEDSRFGKEIFENSAASLTSLFANDM